MNLDLPTLLGGAVFGWSFAVASTSLEAMRRALPRLRRGCPAGNLARDLGQRAEVLLVRPCAGREPSLEQTLGSLAAARRSFTMRCRFALADEGDRALPVARRAAAALEAQGIDVDAVVTGASGPNRKAAQVAALERELGPTGVLIVADSDVDLDGVDLDALVAPLLDSTGAWVAWAPPAEHATPLTPADAASTAVLGGSLHAFPLLAGLDAGGMVGKLFAIRADALTAIGGFAALVDYLGEDMEIARRVRERGGRVVAAPLVARSLAAGRSWEAVIARYARWLTVIRAQRPLLLASYPGLFFATVPILLAAALAAPFARSFAVAAAVLAVVARLAVALFAARVAGRPIRPLLALSEAVLADIVLACAFTRALRSRTITWRDRVLVVDRTGLLRQTAKSQP